jgi:hypothetical protein
MYELLKNALAQQGKENLNIYDWGYTNLTRIEYFLHCDRTMFAIIFSN